MRPPSQGPPALGSPERRGRRNPIEIKTFVTMRNLTLNIIMINELKKGDTSNLVFLVLQELERSVCRCGMIWVPESVLEGSMCNMVCPQTAKQQYDQAVGKLNASETEQGVKCESMLD